MRQDFQVVADNVKMLVAQRQQAQQQAVTRQDIQLLGDYVKNLVNITQQNQQLLRQAEYQRLQLIRRVVALETRIAQLEQELRTQRSMISRVADARPQQLVVQPQAAAAGEDFQGQYVYRPA